MFVSFIYTVWGWSWMRLASSINTLYCVTQDHDVPEESILFVSILAAQLGVHSVAYAFPKVKIITSAMDKCVDENYHILPGVGNYGDRYFGTGPD